MLARGHCLIEGVPGLAKTLTVSTLARVVGGDFTRIQFTPDLVPADIVGTRIWRPSREEFDIEWGPVFANIVLADEINRAPAKVQAALLEVMAEGHVSIGGKTRRVVPEPFLVLATQNPIESEGVYALPEAQRDRFLMQVVIGHPSYQEEIEIARRMSVHRPEVEQVLNPEQLVASAGRRRRGLRAPRRRRLRRPPGHGAPATPRRGGCRSWRPRSSWVPAPAPLSVCSRPAGPSPSCAAALPRTRRTSTTWRPRSSATASLLTYDALANGVKVDEMIEQVLAPDTRSAGRSPPGRGGDSTARHGRRRRRRRCRRRRSARPRPSRSPDAPPTAPRVAGARTLAWHLSAPATPPDCLAAKATVLRRLELDVTAAWTGC